MIKDRNDFAAGLVFIAVGVFYGLMSTDLQLGNALDMGPGYFPFVLCGILVLLGSAILVRSLVIADDSPFGSVPWRALVTIPLAIIVFGAGLTYLGLFAAVFITAFTASLASARTRMPLAVVVSLSLAVLCTLVFVYGVGLHIPVLGSWFTG